MEEVLMEETLFFKIQDLCEEGEKLNEKEKHHDAVKKFQEALKLIPEPVNSWEASTWVMTALGESYFYQDNYKEAFDHYQSAQTCPNGKDNPFLLMRQGQCYYELGQMEEAEKNLILAFQAEGDVIFEGESDYYLDFIRHKIQPAE